MKLVRASKSVAADGSVTLPATLDPSTVAIKTSDGQIFYGINDSWHRLTGVSTSGYTFKSNSVPWTIYYSYWE